MKVIPLYVGARLGLPMTIDEARLHHVKSFLHRARLDSYLAFVLVQSRPEKRSGTTENSCEQDARGTIEACSRMQLGLKGCWAPRNLPCTPKDVLF